MDRSHIGLKVKRSILSIESSDVRVEYKKHPATEGLFIGSVNLYEKKTALTYLSLQSASVFWRLVKMAWLA